MHPALQRSPKGRELPYRGPITLALKKRVVAMAVPKYPSDLVRAAAASIERDKRLEEARMRIAANAVDETHRALALSVAGQIADGTSGVEELARIGTATVASDLAQNRASVIEFQEKVRRDAAELYSKLAPTALEAVRALRGNLERIEVGNAISLAIDFLPSVTLAAVASVELLLAENLAHPQAVSNFESKPVEASLGFLISDALRK